MSYSTNVKNIIKQNEPKKKCCRRIMSDITGLAALESGEDRAAIISGCREHFRCSACFSHFASALFLLCGSVTDPDKQYHLDLSFAGEGEREAAYNILSESGTEMKKSERRGRFILYIKDSAKIEDFLALIGANSAAFELINSKIVREVREGANRQMNCDMANIAKALSSAKKYSDAIEQMYKDKTILRLPPELRETARLRYENSQASLAELGEMHLIPITKSGVKHRLDKIIAYINNEEKQK